MIAAAATAGRSYSGVERAAVLMMLVGEEEAAAILQKLDPEEVRQLGKAMFAVADVSEIEVEDVLDDFTSHARQRTAIGFDPRPGFTNTDDAILGMTLLFVISPVVLMLMGAWTARNWPHDEAEHERVQAELAARAAAE